MTKLSIRTIIKAASFLLIGLVAAVLVSNTLRVPVQGEATDYIVQFYDAEGLVEGNPVTMSGVRVGRVQSIALTPQEDGTALAEVAIKVEREHPVPENVHAAIRYGDMLGARYIALSPGGPDNPARHGDHIPVDATTAPINLTALMNGFEPLFSALEPDQVNQLARGFVDTFEGRTGSVQLLLEQIGSMGENLAANKAVFTQLVTNMNTLMATVENQTPQLERLFIGLNDLTAAVVGDNGQLAALLDSGDRALTSLATMMSATGGAFEDSLTTLTDVTAAWIPNTAEFTTFVETLPQLANKINHSGRYGGFMMLYLCNFTLKAFDLEANIFGPTHSPVCR